MPKYQFVAEGPNQESHKGTVEAASHAAARSKLEQHGFRVLTIVPVEEEARPMPPSKPAPMPGDLRLDPLPTSAAGPELLQPLEPLQPIPAPVQPANPGLEMPVARPAYTAAPQPGPVAQQPISTGPQPSVAPAPQPAAAAASDLPQVHVDEEHWRPLARSFDPWFLDIMFRRFVTPNAVSVIFTLALVGAVISFLVISWTTLSGVYGILSMSSQSGGDAYRTTVALSFLLAYWLFSVLMIIFWLFLVRLGCEALLVVFRMSESIERINKQITRYASRAAQP